MKFSSVELQNAFNKAKPILENITHTKNTISNEIKLLEKFLQEQAINDDFSLPIRSPSNPANLELKEEGLFTNEALLIWNAEKKRIVYQHNQYIASSSFEDGRVIFLIDSGQTVIDRPFIETSFEIRKEVYDKYLSQFLLKITNRYELGEQSEKTAYPS